MPLAVVVIWLFPQVRALKPLLVAALASAAVMGGVVAAAPCPGGAAEPVLAALVAHAVVWGCANGVFATCQWEMIGRGVVGEPGGGRRSAWPSGPGRSWR